MNPFTSLIGILRHCGWGQGPTENRPYPRLCLGEAISVLFDRHDAPFGHFQEDEINYRSVVSKVACAIENIPYEDMGDVGMDIITEWNDASWRTEDDIFDLLRKLQETPDED